MGTVVWRCKTHRYFVENLNGVPKHPYLRFCRSSLRSRYSSSHSGCSYPSPTLAQWGWPRGTCLLQPIRKKKRLATLTAPSPFPARTAIPLRLGVRYERSQNLITTRPTIRCAGCTKRWTASSAILSRSLQTQAKIAPTATPICTAVKWGRIAPSVTPYRGGMSPCSR